MSEPQGGVCPLCGAPRAADGTPACACARLASDAHRTARTTEAAAAEDFDPVRIRPFVVLDGDQDPQDGTAPESTAAPTPPTSREPGERPPSEEAEEGEEGEEGGESEAPPDASDTARPSRRRTHLLLLAGALATAVTAAVLAGVLLYDAPERDGSLGEGVRAPVPDVTSGGAATTGRSSPQASRTEPSSTASDSPGPSATVSETPSRSAVPPSAPSTGATGTASTSPSATASVPPVLRFGDTGPEVVELQLRLRQIGYYGGEAGGEYDRQVENAVRSYQFTRALLQDESGVYGAATRASLEAETDQP
ncbi:peptidoglycan-binding protein [Streptomyces sp. NBC_01235]|uniref:peptidoglycan-binding protein n=1 Tax=Streptomyces sp. NBC_01235 TaxID=2903788 RepID=UPI002E117812|nr:peptidoglycan-binding protein [Streptomyces sp. NBC_01235]